MDQGLRLALLGKPRISRDGAPITGFIYNKALALLAYLAVTGRPHARESLAGLLWGEMPDAAAKANLRKILSALREVAGRELIIDRQSVATDAESQYWLDTEVFESKLQSLTATSLAPASLTERDTKLLDEAVQLYKGDFLEGFYVRDAPAFEEWVLSERERLRQLVLQVLYRLAAYCTLRGEYARGIDYTTRLLALEPWHEEVHQQMMLLLALSGQRSAAVEQYQKCRRILAKEMGAQPNADTVALYRKITSGEITDQPSAGSLFHTLPHGTFRSWPAQATPFVGRVNELATLTGRLRSPDCRLVTIVGLSGVGKTRLALQAAAEVSRSFKHGVCFVPLAADASGELLYPALSESLGLTAESPRDSRSRVLEYLRDKEVLLVFDQSEQLHAAVPFTDLLQRARGVKLLVTTLERLNLRGEWTLALQGLRVPASENPAEIAESDAVQLFVQGAHRVRADYDLSSADMASVSRICRLVEGIPLGIELASSWTRALTCREIADEIEGSYGFLVGSGADEPARHHSLAAALDQSWNRLSEAEKVVFRRLCVFRGGFTREAAEQVAGASLPQLVSLIDRCLVQSTSLGRFFISRLPSQYGLEKLGEIPEEEQATRDRHSQYYATFLKHGTGRFLGTWQDDALPEIAAEKENLQVAWLWDSAHVEG